MDIKTAKLIYFSTTGTTKKILDGICKGLNIEEPHTLDLTVPRVRNLQRIDIEEDIVIIGVPVYEERIPCFLNNVLNNINGYGKPVILVSVYGNIGSGVALNELQELCAKKNMNVVGAASFIGEHSFSTEEVPVAEGRPNKKDLELSILFGEKIFESLNLIDDITNIQIKIPQGEFPLIARILPPNSARLFTKQPTVDSVACTKCGACIKICPMNAINDSTLEINEELCLRCFACVRKCPLHSRKKEYKKRWVVVKFLKKGNQFQKQPIFYLNS